MRCDLIDTQTDGQTEPSSVTLAAHARRGLTTRYISSRVYIQDFFMGRGGGGEGDVIQHINVASRGSGGMLPQKIFVFYVGF